jgi:putative transposase
VNDRHLRVVLAQYVECYNTHRPHRSLEQQSPEHADGGPARPATLLQSIHAVERGGVVGGLINEYQHAA